MAFFPLPLGEEGLIQVFVRLEVIATRAAPHPSANINLYLSISGTLTTAIWRVGEHGIDSTAQMGVFSVIVHIEATYTPGFFYPGRSSCAYQPGIRGLDVTSLFARPFPDRERHLPLMI